MQAKNINPQMLFWARSETGASLEEAAKKIGLKDSKQSSAAEKLRAFENGENHPTKRQLFRIAEVLRRSLITFYLETPPIKDNRNSDFRRTNAVLTERDQGILEALVRNIRTRQDLTIQVLIEEENPEPLDFVDSMNIAESSEAAVERVKRALGLLESPIRIRKNPKKLFKILRHRVERLGVYVLLATDYGPFRSSLSGQIFRGLAISDPIAPFVVIYRRDNESTWSFTLLHELIHLFLGHTGISGAFEATTSNRTEGFCNAIAGKILLPDYDLKGLVIGKSVPEIRQAIADISMDYSVSMHMVAYRLQQNNLITSDQYRRFASELTKYGHEQQERQSVESGKQAKTGGPSIYVLQKHRVGLPLLELVGRNLRNGNLSHSKAATILGTKIGAVEPLLAAALPVTGTSMNTKFQ